MLSICAREFLGVFATNLDDSDCILLLRIWISYKLRFMMDGSCSDSKIQSESSKLFQKPNLG